MDLMPFDEINKFKEFVAEYKSVPAHTPEQKRRFRDDLWEYIEFLLIEAYEYGNVQARADLGLLDDEKTYLNPEKMCEAVNRSVAGKTAFQRMTEYADDDESTVEDFTRVAETDATRAYNEGVQDTAEETGIPGVRKRWNTAGDDRVRDTHEYLYGMEVPLDKDFYTYDGDHARAPGMFSLPENNINCRCTISLILP